MIALRDAAVAVVLAATFFTGARVLSTGSDAAARHDLDAAFAELAAVPERTVCPEENGCREGLSDFTLFLFVRNGDCAGSLHDARVLEELRQSLPAGRLRIVGVAERMDTSEVRAFAVASGVGYPMRAGSEGLGRTLEAARGEAGNRPVKVLVDRDGREMRRWLSVPEIDAQRADAERMRAELGLDG